MSAAPAQPAAARPPARVRLRYFSAQNVPLLLSVGVLVAMIVLYVVLFVVKNSRAPGGFELSTTVGNTLSLGLTALGQTMVVLTGGIDLSVGGVVDLTNAVAAQQMRDNPASIVLVSLLVLLIGAGAGLLNGLLVAYGRLQPIIVTLATLAIWQGIALLALPSPGGTIPPTLTNMLAGTIPALFNLPFGLVVLVALILVWRLLRRTSFLVALYAIGNDERAARANGTPVARAKVLAYTLGGLFSG